MDPIKLTNASIPFTFDGKEYEVKKANLQQVILFQRRAKEIGDEKDAGGDLLMASYALWLILRESDPTLTEDNILNKCPGDLDVMAILSQLGFMSQQKVELMNRVRDTLASKPEEKK